MKARESATAWLLMAPALLVLGVFGIFPIFYAFYVSLHAWRIRQGEVVGLEHYLRALGDPAHLGLAVVAAALIWLAWRWGRRGSKALEPGSRGRAGSWVLASIVLVAAAVVALAIALGGLADSGDLRLYNGFKITLFYVLGTIPAEICISMVLAYLLFRVRRGKGVFRMLFFLPYVTPMIATAVVFRTIFSPHPSSMANRFWGWFGMDNQRWLFEGRSVVTLLLEGIGVGAPEWVNDLFPSLALVSIILYNIWVYVGYNTVIMLAGLSAIPRHFYEAAAIDGASAARSFAHVTLPLLSPTLFFLSLVGVIGTFKAFNHIYIMRTAGAQDSVDVLPVVIFDQIYQFHDAGYASALALILFGAILLLTVFQNRVLGRRVFYGD
jgi:ABC-type sugar transport system permease subunit